MTVFDYAVVGVLACSVILGLWRGVVSEILALAAWVVAFLAARVAGEEVANLLTGWIGEPVLRMAAGYAAVVVGVLLVFALARVLLRLLLKAAGLGVLDRLLGGAFGVMRGMLIVLLAVMVAGLTPLPKAEWWREARLAPPLETMVLATRPWLPADAARRIRYR
jgi:membrane protein required for colicin V production